MNDLMTRIQKMVVDQLDIETDRLTPDARFIGDLGADSLDVVELVMAFEEEFEIEVSDEDAESLKTFGDAVAFISSKQ